MLFELARVWLKIFLRGSPEMPKKKYIVNLYDAEREQLQLLLRSGKQIAAALSVGRATVERVRESFVERGLDALNERPRPGKKPKLDAKAKTRLIAEACSDALEGRTHWTMQLLADRPVELKVVETISEQLH